MLEALREIKADVQDRYERLSKLPVDICPEGKLSREIARDPKYRMPVRLVFLDEFQEYFDLGDISKEIASLLVYLVKVAPAAGVGLVDATQRPSGVGGGQIASQFISFRDTPPVRFSLRTGSWQVSDLVLGSGAEALIAARGWGRAQEVYPNASDSWMLPAALTDLPPTPLYGRAPDAKLPL